VRRVFVLLALIVATFGFTACSASSSGSKPRATPPPVDFRGHTHVDVDAQFNLFTPPDIIISPGTTVTWHNKDSVAHNISKATDLIDFHGNFGANVQQFGPGASYSFKFTAPGVNYYYTCTIHTGMSGRVEVVTQAPAPTTSIAP
jgi:plastocyanin